MALEYNMRNLHPDNPRDGNEASYILGRLDEKEAQLYGIEAVLTFEYHHSGGPRFNVRSIEEVDMMIKNRTNGPEIWRYWRRDQIIENARLILEHNSYK